MSQKMKHVTVKHKYQVTIPATLRKKLRLSEGDLLEAQERNGAIILTPTTTVKKGTSIKKNPQQYFGSGKGLFKSTKEIDDFIRNERAQWTS